MLIILISLVLLIISICTFQPHDENKWQIYFVGSSMALLAGAIIITIIFTSLGNDLSYVERVEEKDVVAESHELLNLKDTTKADGKFVGVSVVGTGSMFGGSKTKTYYVFYMKSDKGYKYNKISPEDDDVYIEFCGEEEQARYEVKEDSIKAILTKKPNIWVDGRSVDYLGKKIGDEVIEDYTKYHRYYVLYVPKGSIVQEYNINME